MEGVQRALTTFSYWRITKWFYFVFYKIGCKKCISRHRNARLFKGQWLDVSKPVEPEMLIWENFGVNNFSRFVRVILYIIFIIIILILLLVGVSGLAVWQNDIGAQIPNLVCPNEVDPYAANLDYMEK